MQNTAIQIFTGQRIPYIIRYPERQIRLENTGSVRLRDMAERK